MTLRVENLSFSYDRREYVISGADFEAHPGEVTVIIGANGAGKTTMLKCISALYRHSGSVTVDGAELTRGMVVERLSYLEQNTDCDVNLTVFEVVLLGMVQTLGFRVSPEDIELVNSTLDRVGIRHLAGRRIGEISGGQRQLVFIAQALVKRPEILILDEPTSALDLYHQMMLMDFIRRLTVETGCITVATLHHLDVAMRYADRIVVLNGHTVYAEGAPDEVMTEETLERVYHVRSRFVTDADGHRFMLIEGPVIGGV